MGTRLRARTSANKHTQQGSTSPGLTRGMRWMLLITLVVVAGGLAVALALSTASPALTAAPPSDRSHTSATEAAQPTPVAGSEVPPPDEAVTAPLNRLPALPPRTALVTLPLPADGHQTGGVVTGFPLDVAGPFPGALVLETAVSSAGDTLQATLTARTDASPEEVHSYYRDAFATLGLVPTSTDVDAPYSDGTSAISVAVLPGSGTGTVYSVFAVLRAE